MANHPQAVALLFALSCFSVPVVLLPSALRGWQSVPAVPAGTPLFLPPALGQLAAEGERLGLRPHLLSEPGRAGSAGPPSFMAAPGFVFFTSGSTGTPRPVYRTAAQLVEAGRLPTAAVGFPARGGLIGALPFDRTFGMHHRLMAATVLRRPLALLALFASGDYHYWAGTPVMADVLSRCPLPGAAPRPHPAPPICVISGRLSGPVCEAFRARFGVPLRQLYGTTETGAVTMDAARADLVRPGTAGRPLPGVRVRIGDDPRTPLPAGTPGRVWVSSPGCTPGYGFPPDLEPPPSIGEWWASPDVGELDDDGYLTLAGRMDDCFRTGAGHIVSTATIASALETHPRIVEAVVVPIGPATEPVLAALIECVGALDMDEVREQLARMLPPWSQPRVLAQVHALPRLPSGKPDRLACIARLEQSR
jgi:acyl-CoA synthetase (AMP-forming)/AMP-acid ligase II